MATRRSTRRLSRAKRLRRQMFWQSMDGTITIMLIASTVGAGIGITVAALFI